MSEATVVKKSTSFLNRAVQFISNSFLTNKQNTVTPFTLHIPDSIYYRTKLMCNYITYDEGYHFDISNFLMLLYLDFIKTSVKTYNPHTTYENICKYSYAPKTVILSDGTNSCAINRSTVNYVKVDITINNSDYLNGELILKELFAIYHHKYSVGNLLESLWIGFITSYALGENKRIYHTVITLLENCFGEQN